MINAAHDVIESPEAEELRLTLIAQQDIQADLVDARAKRWRAARPHPAQSMERSLSVGARRSPEPLGPS